MTMFAYPLPSMDTLLSRLADRVRIVRKVICVLIKSRVPLLMMSRVLLLADYADTDTVMMIDVLGPTHRMIEATVGDIVPLSMMTNLGIDTADTMTTTTTHRTVGGAEDMVATMIQKIGRLTDILMIILLGVLVEVKGIDLRRGSIPQKIQVDTLPTAVPVVVLTVLTAIQTS